MTSEELQLLKENNQMLKYICAALQNNGGIVREFLINLTANMVANNVNKK